MDEIIGIIYHAWRGESQFQKKIEEVSRRPELTQYLVEYLQNSDRYSHLCNAEFTPLMAAFNCITLLRNRIRSYWKVSNEHSQFFPNEEAIKELLFSLYVSPPLVQAQVIACLARIYLMDLTNFTGSPDGSIMDLPMRLKTALASDNLPLVLFILRVLKSIVNHGEDESMVPHQFASAVRDIVAPLWAPVLNQVIPADVAVLESLPYANAKRGFAVTPESVETAPANPAVAKADAFRMFLLVEIGFASLSITRRCLQLIGLQTATFTGEGNGEVVAVLSKDVASLAEALGVLGERVLQTPPGLKRAAKVIDRIAGQVFKFLSAVLKLIPSACAQQVPVLLHSAIRMLQHKQQIHENGGESPTSRPSSSAGSGGASSRNKLRLNCLLLIHALYDANPTHYAQSEATELYQRNIQATMTDQICRAVLAVCVEEVLLEEGTEGTLSALLEDPVTWVHEEETTLSDVSPAKSALYLLSTLANQFEGVAKSMLIQPLSAPLTAELETAIAPTTSAGEKIKLLFSHMRQRAALYRAFGHATQGLGLDMIPSVPQWMNGVVMQDLRVALFPGKLMDLSAAGDASHIHAMGALLAYRAVAAIAPGLQSADSETQVFVLKTLAEAARTLNAKVGSEEEHVKVTLFVAGVAELLSYTVDVFRPPSPDSPGLVDAESWSTLAFYLGVVVGYGIPPAVSAPQLMSSCAFLLRKLVNKAPQAVSLALLQPFSFPMHGRQFAEAAPLIVQLCKITIFTSVQQSVHPDVLTSVMDIGRLVIQARNDATVVLVQPLMDLTERALATRLNAHTAETCWALQRAVGLLAARDPQALPADGLSQFIQTAIRMCESIAHDVYSGSIVITLEAIEECLTLVGNLPPSKDSDKACETLCELIASLLTDEVTEKNCTPHLLRVVQTAALVHAEHACAHLATPLKRLIKLLVASGGHGSSRMNFKDSSSHPTGSAMDILGFLGGSDDEDDDPFCGSNFAGSFLDGVSGSHVFAGGSQSGSILRDSSMKNQLRTVGAWRSTDLQARSLAASVLVTVGVMALGMVEKSRANQWGLDVQDSLTVLMDLIEAFIIVASATGALVDSQNVIEGFAVTAMALMEAENEGFAINKVLDAQVTPSPAGVDTPAEKRLTLGLIGLGLLHGLRLFDADSIPVTCRTSLETASKTLLSNQTAVGAGLALLQQERHPLLSGKLESVLRTLISIVV